MTGRLSELGEAEGVVDHAGGQGAHPVRCLPFGAVGEDRVLAQRRSHAGEAAQAAVAALWFLAEQAVADRIEPCAAVLLRQRGAEQAEAGDLGEIGSASCRDRVCTYV